MRCVGSEGTVELDTNHDSIPWRLIGTVLRVEARDGKIRLHHGPAEIAVHAEVSGRRPRVADAAHYHGMPGIVRAAATLPRPGGHRHGRSAVVRSRAAAPVGRIRITARGRLVMIADQAMLRGWLTRLHLTALRDNGTACWMKPPGAN